MGWGRLWAARGGSESIFKKVQKITSELPKKHPPTLRGFFLFFFSSPLEGGTPKISGSTTTTLRSGSELPPLRSVVERSAVDNAVGSGGGGGRALTIKIKKYIS